MVSRIATISIVLAAVVMSTMAQRSPYAGASDPGVLPQYLPEGAQVVDRFGDSEAAPQPPKLHAGTLETEDVYNRVQTWPDEHKPFWYLNSIALQNQREQQQQQQRAQEQAAQAQNRPLPFAAGSRRNSSFRRQNS